MTRVPARPSLLNARSLVRWNQFLAVVFDAGAACPLTLGVFYDNGLGVPQDHIRSYMWFDLSAAQGRDGAAAFRDLVKRRMTPGQIAEAQKLAREWKPTKQPVR